MQIVSYLPNCIINILATVLGTLGYYLAKNRRKIGLKNLTLCFPEMTAKQKEKIIKDHFKSLVLAIFDYPQAFYANKSEIKQLVTIIGKDYHKETTQPIIYLCPHFIGLEFAALRLSADTPGCGIYSEQKNAYLTQQIKNARERFGAKIFPRTNGLRQIIKALKQKQMAFFYLPDQDFGDTNSIFVPFFAFPNCATVKILPKIVTLTQAVVVPVSIFRVNNKYQLTFHPAWENYPTNNLEDDIIRMNQAIEEMIKLYPEQYFWLHKRFKTQPNMPRGAIYNDCK